MEETSKIPRIALVNISHSNNNLLSYPAIYVDMQMKNGWFCRDFRIAIPDHISLEIQKKSFGYTGLPRKKFELEFKNHKDQTSVLSFYMKFTLDHNDGDSISFPREVDISQLTCDDPTIKVGNPRLQVDLVLGRQLVGNDGFTNGDFIRTTPHFPEPPYRDRW